MPSCAFHKCINHRSSKAFGITFHGFPKDLNNRQKWVDIVRQQRMEPNWTPTDRSTVCSIHFKTDQIYTTSEGYQRTIAEAMPYFQGMITDNFSCEPGSQTFLQAKVYALISDKERLEKENKSLKRKNKMLEEKCRYLKEALKNIVI